MIEVDDMGIHYPLIGCGVKEQRQGRFLSRGFHWEFCKASIKAEDVVANEFCECVLALSVIERLSVIELFKVISHKEKE